MRKQIHKKQPVEHPGHKNSSIFRVSSKTLTLFATTIGVVTGVVTTWFSTGKPSITNLRNFSDTCDMQIEKQLGTTNIVANCMIAMPMKNRSFFRGHISQVEIVSEKNDHLSYVKIIEFDKSDLGPFETRDFFVKFSFLISENSSYLLKQTGESIIIKFRYFDNNNSMITFNETNLPAITTVRLSPPA